MTEERKKELSFKYSHCGGLDIQVLIDIVAAEVWKEGRREGIEEFCNRLCVRLRHGPQAGIALIVEDEAERLKEKI